MQFFTFFVGIVNKLGRGKEYFDDSIISKQIISIERKVLQTQGLQHKVTTFCKRRYERQQHDLKGQHCFGMMHPKLMLQE